jgi:hypothetical protein
LPEVPLRTGSKFVSVGEWTPAERSPRLWQVE